MTFQQARRLLLSFPGVEERPCYGTPGFRVHGKFLARLKEDGATLVVKCGDEERDFRMEADPSTFVSVHSKATARSRSARPRHASRRARRRARTGTHRPGSGSCRVLP